MQKTTITATLYSEQGIKTEFEVQKIYSEDAEYINEHKIKISFEKNPLNFMDIIAYFDDGTLLDDNQTPDEIIIFSKGRSCYDTIREGVSLLKKRKNNE